MSNYFNFWMTTPFTKYMNLIKISYFTKIKVKSKFIRIECHLKKPFIKLKCSTALQNVIFMIMEQVVI